ncbi:2726_t:CDS:1 [Dentiscutata erythropus]|uniref:2726_t:CDS:1 n=1 Tax=Dentiscutata erythropus TaxID=1348616 RepID=A0A9N9IS00_9GLOM|nr:2726_t:CDS:1 [Dentiscutata erythropus]
MNSSINSFRLPADCVRGIFYHLLDDYEALFTCILVNRSWCRSAIPLLWSDIFNGESPSSEKRIKIISTYIKCLSDFQRQTLINNNIKLQEDFKPALFDYPKFLRVLNCNYFDKALHDWCKKVINPSSDDLDFRTTLNVCNQIISQYIFDHSTGLYTLCLGKHKSDGQCLMHLPSNVYPEELCYTFSKLTELHINEWLPIITQNLSSVLLFFEKLSLCSRRITNLTISLNQISGTAYHPEVFKHLFSLINSQCNLQSFTMTFSINLQSSLLFSSLSNQSHSLKYLELNRFYDIPLLLPYLSSFNLETLKFAYSNDLIIQHNPSPLPSLPSETQFRIKNLIISEPPDSTLYPFFSLIAKMSGSNLTNLSFNGCDEILTKTIGENCLNLTSLTIMTNFSLFECFLKSLSKLENLKYLDVKKARNDIEFTNEMILQFAKTIPNTLEELDSDLITDQKHLNIFKEFKTPLSELTIHPNETSEPSVLQ